MAFTSIALGVLWYGISRHRQLCVLIVITQLLLKLLFCRHIVGYHFSISEQTDDSSFPLIIKMSFARFLLCHLISNQCLLRLELLLNALLI